MPADSALSVPARNLVELVEQLVCLLGPAADAEYVSDGQRPSSAPGSTRVSVHHPEGEVLGTIHCSVDSEAARARVELIAQLAGAALAQAQYARDLAASEAAMRRVAEQLQDALLPAVPELPSTLLEVRYRAAASEARVGGDFYDVFPLPDGRVLLVVGDVVGKGVAAASRLSRITQTCRALALQGVPLDILLSELDHQVSLQDPEIMATMWCGMYWPDSGEVVFASRGHPPALLLRADGDALWLESEGLPLGMSDLAESPPEIRSRRLDSRDLLVLYTDGVVESSGDVTEGQRALLDAFDRRSGEPLAVVIDEMLDELLDPAGHVDDAVLLMLRRR